MSGRSALRSDWHPTELARRARFRSPSGPGAFATVGMILNVLLTVLLAPSRSGWSRRSAGAGEIERHIADPGVLRQERGESGLPSSDGACQHDLRHGGTHPTAGTPLGQPNKAFVENEEVSTKVGPSRGRIRKAVRVAGGRNRRR